MNLDQLQQFFMWCTLVSFALYLITVVSILSFRSLVLTIHKKLFNMSEETVDLAMHRYLGNFKLLTIIFCFVPWVALVLMQ